MVLYRVLLGLALAIYSPVAFFRQAIGGRKIGQWRQRLFPAPFTGTKGGIWIHAVSVGEVGAANAILRALREEGTTVPLVLSSSTAAGMDLARLSRDADSVLPFPFDLSMSVERTLDSVGPSLVLLTETEIWPLFLERCARRKIPVALVNGRISDRSFRRYRALSRFFRRTLSRISLFAMQTDQDARRVERIGAAAGRVRVTGSVKFDRGAPRQPELEKMLLSWAGGRKIWVCGSTHGGEEEAILNAWSRLELRPLLVLAPRRPERFSAVYELIGGRGIRAVSRSRGGAAPEVVVLDTVGELSAVYACADIAFIGGTLVSAGGHNPIEAWAHGVPVLVGTHTKNFRDIVDRGLEAGAAVEVRDAEELGHVAARLLGDDAERSRRGSAAQRLVEENRGASRATASAVLALRKTA